MGANDGTFSRIASDKGILAISFDIDPAAVEQDYRQVKAKSEKNIVPLVLDLTNPSPAIGWHNRERESFIDRAPADMVLALALIHIWRYPTMCRCLNWPISLRMLENGW